MVISLVISVVISKKLLSNVSSLPLAGGYSLGRLGNYTYPESGLEKTLKRVKQAYTSLKDGISTENLAQSLGVVAKSGNFINIVAAMRMFGLVSGTGTLKTTELGERLIHPILGKDDERRAREEAWLKVDLIRRLHNRFRGKIPARMEEFYAILREITGAERAELEKKGGKVQLLYREALSSLSLIEETAEASVVAIDGEKSQEITPSIPLPADLMEFKYGGIYLRIPAEIAGQVVPIVIKYIESKKAAK